jgi:mono/diheme cytochrome c family protein
MTSRIHSFIALLLLSVGGSRAAELALTPGGVWHAHDMKRPRPPVVAPPPPAEPAPPPPDAIVLFDGKDLSHWTAKLTRGADKGKTVAPQWRVEGGSMEVVANGGDLISAERFGDCQLHIEWASPAKVEGSGQGRGNSGVLIQGLCEVQILDSYENDTYPDGQAGAIYSEYPPLVNVCRKPGEWQTYDITIQVARLDAQKKVLEPTRVTVIHNGVLIQNAVPLENNRQTFTLALQDHLNPVRFRNVWLRKLAGSGSPAQEAAAKYPVPAEAIDSLKTSPAPRAKAGAKIVPAAAALPPHPFLPPSIGFDQGEQLLAGLNCSSCHALAGIAPERFPAKKAPLFGKEGLRLAPRFIADFLADPQGEKPGSTMPDLLHGLAPAEKQAAVEALTHFLIAESPGDDEIITGDEALVSRGRVLYHEIGCVACHAPQDPPPGHDAQAVENQALTANSVPHGQLAKKYSVAQLTEFLLTPGKYRPERRMPSLRLTKPEAAAIAMYLLREQATSAARTMKKGAGKMTAGLRYELFDGDFPNCGPALERATPVAIGSIPEIDLSQWQQEGQSFAARFSGQFDVPTDGAYTFYTRSAGGSRLWVDGQEVVNNDGAHRQVEKGGAVELKSGAHEFVLAYFQPPKMRGTLTALFEGPGQRKRPIKKDNVSHLAAVLRPLVETEFTVDAAKAGRGKQLFGTLGCAHCHSAPGISGVPAAAFSPPKMLELKGDAPRGCLASAPGKGTPDFHLSDEQRAAILRTLADPQQLRKALSPAQEIARTMNLLNCYACHARDGVGGPPSPRSDYFRSYGEVDLGDEGRIPPHLDKVGAKLRPEWMTEVLLRKGAVRPYMATRMPQFSSVVERLPDLFVKADSTAAPPGPPVYQADIAAAGRTLVGTGGYACIVCHSFGTHPSLGVPAIDLTTMSRRLRPDWFARYVVDPQALRPGTRMPSFWPQGQAANRDILGGETGKQVAALWMYLSKGVDADPPPGLIQAKMEIVADKEPVVYRNFIADAGSRAIAVGYPEKVNLAFDANDLRLALLWHGAFIDASRHRSGRGGGFASPIGSGVLNFPTGPAFAALAQPDAPWPGASGENAGGLFRGYSYDDQRRPSFRYAWLGVDVEDTFTPIAASGKEDSGFRRTLALHTVQPPANACFRAVVGHVEDKGGGLFLVEERLRLRIEGATPILRGSGAKAELLVPIPWQNNQAKIVETFSW